jgi:iron uptake system component EfeO
MELWGARVQTFVVASYDRLVNVVGEKRFAGTVLRIIWIAAAARFSILSPNHSGRHDMSLRTSTTSKSQQLYPTKSPRLRVALFLTLACGTAGAIPQGEPLDSAAAHYRPELSAAVEQCLTAAQTLRERVLAHDLEGAKQAWIASRVGWERSEVFTSGFTSELDAEIDAWPSAVTGYHFIEARLFGARQLDVLDPINALIFHLTDLRLKIRDMPLTGQGMLEGTAKLAYEIGENKADGGESRFSGTSLDDMRNNADGIEAAYRIVFASVLTSRNPALAKETSTKIKELQMQLHAGTLAEIDADQIRTTSEDLVLTLQRAAPVLGLQKPSLSDLAQM